jgi:hypothetical protein
MIAGLAETLSEETEPLSQTDKVASQNRPLEAAGNESQVLWQVAQLIEEHKFSDARNLLAMKHEEESEGLNAETMAKAIQDIEGAEERFLEEKILTLSLKKKSLDRAHRFLEEERFDEAVAELDALEEKNLATPEIRVLRQRAVGQLINEERNRAAKMFLAGKQATDFLEKERYFNASYNILNKLIEQFPSSDLILKVKSHRRKVLEELDKLRKMKNAVQS